MATASSSTHRLSLHLHPHAAELPAGVLMHALEGVRAVMQLEPGQSQVHVALPPCSRAELRWIVDQLVRKVAALTGLGGATLVAAPGLGHGADDTLVTLGLDLHQRTRGEVTMQGRPDLQARVDRVGSLEQVARAWVNEDPSTRTSLTIAHDVCAWAEERPEVTVEVMAEPALRELGMGLLLAVGQGSKASPPRLILARYRPAAGAAANSAAAAPLMLVGKGITFDTGGINLKPYESYVSMMKNDMAGAAVAYSLFRGLVEAGHDQPLLLVIPTCENAIGSAAMRPGALVRSYRGLTVRVDHTDAEGRLVLADGLAYATDRFAPQQVLCFATLTTAALVAYGPYATPVHFAGAELQARLGAACERTGEDLHFFPERIWHLEANRDREADLRNTARLPGDASRGAGSRNAAHFLKHFTTAPLCHLDIFASTWNWAGDAPGCAHGATGAPLRTLLSAFGVA